MALDKKTDVALAWLLAQRPQALVAALPKKAALSLALLRVQGLELMEHHVRWRGISRRRRDL